MIRFVCMSAALCLSLSTGARAAPCDAITDAFKATAAAPAYRQTITVASPPATIEQVVVGNDLFMRDGNRWRKLRMKPDGRLGMLNAILKDSTYENCRAPSAEKLNGADAKVYRYTMTPPAGLPGGKPMEQILWVDAAKGVVLKLVTGEMTATISYDNVTAPAN